MDHTLPESLAAIRGGALNCRSAGLDLVKWTAILSMVADHLRYLWPSADGLFVVGRLAFPLFCLVIACHVSRAQPGALYTAANARYLSWMLAFSVLAEGPYRWLDNGSHTLNVMPTLTLGLLVAWGVKHPQPAARIVGLGSAGLALVFGDRLMYGLPGVLLPAACLMLWSRGRPGWLVPCLLAMGANLTNSWLWAHPWQPFSLLVLATAAMALPLGLRMLAYQGASIVPVGRWAYGFYPLHLMAIKALQYLDLPPS
ncbi:TraX family protein [Pseudomonas sp. BNK-43-a]|uniref:TraX family protein n=1 Tax=unclassified Pseudomonas TaxID=196821 RepID=UPI0039BFBD37